MNRNVSQDWSERLIDTLPKCEVFESDAALKDIFADPRLSPWREALPDAPTRNKRLAGTIEYLWDKRDSAGNPAFLLFLRVLSERDPAQVCRHNLTEMVDEIERPISISPRSTHTQQTIRFLPEQSTVNIYDAIFGVIGNALKIATTGYAELNLSGKNLSSLPEQIWALTELRVLNLASNHLMTLPPEIQSLKDLETLNLKGNKLTTLPPEISHLSSLRELDLSDNALTELPPEIGQFPNLQHLNLSDNPLTVLPAEMAQLTALQTLDVRNTQLPIPAELLAPSSESLTPSLSPDIYNRVQKALEVSKVFDSKKVFRAIFADERLSPWRNSLPEHPDVGRKIHQIINTLFAEYNEQGENALSLLLRVLGDRNTPTLRRELVALADEIEVKVSSTRKAASLAPASVILDYYFRLQYEQHPLNEAKMLLVGQGGVGKTSLVNRLVANTYREVEIKTEGIAVRRWVVSVNDEPIYLNIWDFGGQDIMHATHQFFLTRRSLYLLVLDARKGEQESNLEYWLQIVQSFGGDSPVIVVVNKTDEHFLELNRRGLRAKYPNIRAFVETSCKSGAGIGELRRCILRELEDMEHIRSVWLKSWFEVKNRLEQMDRDYISYDDYIAICYEVGLADPEHQRRLIAFLHDLGVVLNYRDDPRLEETNILNPEWVTSAVYKILNDRDLKQAHGLLTRRQLGNILDRRYPRDKYDFILGMMRKFELCFPMDGGREERYLLPDLLTRQEPVLDWSDLDTCLNFHYHYSVLPSSVISRFIVRMYAYIDNRQVWWTGVLLHYPDHGNQALVKADLVGQRVMVSVRGNPSTRREFLAVIRSHFDHIHGTITGLTVTEVVPIPGHPGAFEEYAHLLMLERNGEESFYPRGVEQRIAIQPLLDGIESLTARGIAGLPPALINRLQRAFLATGYFDDQDKLQDLFVDLRIAPWANVIPTRGDAQSRAQALISLLQSPQHALNGEYALALFIQVVRDHLDPENMLRDELLKLTEEVRRVLREIV